MIRKTNPHGRQKFSSLLVAALCLSLIIPTLTAQNAQADSPTFTTSNNVDGTLSIIGCTAACSGALEIPGIIDGKLVTIIGSSGVMALRSKGLTSVTIPRSVTTINSGAFWDNALTSVIFLGDAPIDGGYVFYNNPNLTFVVVPSDSIGFGEKYSQVTVSRTGAAIHSVSPPDIGPKYKSGAKLTGKINVGKTLGVKKGKWAGSRPLAYHYQWYKCKKPVRKVLKKSKVPAGCKAIARATKVKFKLTVKQKHSFIVVMISATNSVNTSKIVTASLGKVK